MDFKRLLKLNGIPIDWAVNEFQLIKRKPNMLQWQMGKARSIMKYHFEQNTFYKHFVNQIPVNWEDLPIISKNHLRGDYLSKMPSCISKKDMLASSTSGSSGTPMQYAKDRFCHALTWALIEDRYQSAGVDLNDLQARFWGIPLNLKDFIKERLKDRLCNRSRFVVFDLSDKVLEDWLVRFKNRRFKYIYGYPNTLLCFVHYLIKKGVILKEVCPTLKTCIITSEVCSKEDQQLLEQVLGVPVANEYGASEFGILGFQDESEWKVSDELVYLEVVDDENRVLPDGVEGRLICTSLFNKATPFIRYEVGDIVKLRRHNNQTWITGLIGRVSDMVLLPSGKKLSSNTFFYFARKIVEQTGAVQEFVVKQKSLDHFELHMVSKRNLKIHEIQKIQDGMNIYLEKGLKLDIVYVDSIERKGNGKFQIFSSDIN